MGDMVQVWRGGYYHVAIYLGATWDGRDYIHNAKGDCVSFATQDEFSKGAPVTLRKAALNDFSHRQAIVNRATSLIGKKYDLINFNCEHFATYAQTGQAESPQLAGAVCLGLAGLFLAAVALRRS